MPDRIVLVRHGPSVHAETRGSFDRDDVRQWLDAYDAAGIQPTCQPPAPLVRVAVDAEWILSSDLPRAVSSAERLAGDRPVSTSHLLRETALPIPRWPTRIPLRAWWTVIHLGWMIQVSRGIDMSEEDRRRAVAAVDWVGGMAAGKGTALAVTHGVFRRIMAQQLLASGWKSDGRVGGYSHWSAWSFSRPQA